MTFVLLKTMIPRVINNIPKLVEIGEVITEIQATKNNKTNLERLAVTHRIYIFNVKFTKGYVNHYSQKQHNILENALNILDLPFNYLLSSLHSKIVICHDEGLSKSND
ncbi:hypothetical protein NQ317_009875 [Molorchus minor]|uniref:Uncharacterized protein n=1 Tax=Molorchus minor TaxID=1323400 RepID=A0ABQ9K3S4_9CUCU|nr:hypothetical protein NQ317_009875 [Molorchus minor]